MLLEEPLLSIPSVPGSPPHGSAQRHSLGSNPAWNFGTPHPVPVCASAALGSHPAIPEDAPALPSLPRVRQNPSHFPDLSQSRNFQTVLLQMSFFPVVNPPFGMTLNYKPALISQQVKTWEMESLQDLLSHGGFQIKSRIF